jgi:hypothetical protein
MGLNPAIIGNSYGDLKLNWPIAFVPTHNLLSEALLKEATS